MRGQTMQKKIAAPPRAGRGIHGLFRDERVVVDERPVNKGAQDSARPGR